MDTQRARELIEIIKQEERRRSKECDSEHPEIASHLWLFEQAPFLAEFCLIVLVAVRHHVERRLLQLAARAQDQGQRIDRARYEELLPTPKSTTDWKAVDELLGFRAHRHYNTIEALRLIANLYKHSPTKSPDKDLLRHLKMDTSVDYADLTMSLELQRGLAVSVGLPEASTYAEITERILEHVDQFLIDIGSKRTISDLAPGRVDYSSFLH